MVDKVEEMLERYPDIWKTKSAFMNFIRGGIRRSLWKNHPVKIRYINNNKIRIPNPNPRGRVKEVWGGVCHITGEVLPLAQLEVDHLKGNHSLRSTEDLKSFIENIVFVTEDDLSFVSKEAHKVKSFSDKQGISFEQAAAEKLAISLIKEKKDKSWLEGRGVVPASNQARRREQIVEEVLRGG